jgi:hypothetical protein
MRTLEELANLLQRQETADLAGSRLGADTTEPSAEQDGGDSLLNGSSPLGVVSGFLSGQDVELDVQGGLT